MEKEYKMSAARAQELQEELNYLKTTRSDEVAEQIKVARGFEVGTGEFSAEMKVESINDGPVTIILDTREL